MRRWEWLDEMVDQKGFTTGVEVGVLDGKTSRYLLERHPALQMTGVDIHPMPDLGPRFTRLQMDSAEAAAHVDRVGFVFIDADHSFEAVRRDIEAWMPKTGFLCGHDFSKHHPGVVRAVSEYRYSLVGHDNVWVIHA